MKKIILLIVITVISAMSLVGCAKCISTETSIVQVKITDSHYEPQSQQPSYNVVLGMVTMDVTPAEYKTTVEYQGTEYNFYDTKTYDKYSDHVGEYANAVLETKKYDDGTVKYEIIGLQ